MGKHPKHSEELIFLKKLKQAAAFYIKHGAEKEFAELIASIPISISPFKNDKKRTHTSQGKSKRNRNKTPQGKENKPVSKKTRCLFCKNKYYVHIKAHYRNSHNIDDQFWIRDVTDNDNRRNGTTCLICEVDQNNVKSLRKHFIEDHNIKLLEKKRKEDFKGIKGQTSVVIETGRPRERKSIENNPAIQEERDKIADCPIALEREIIESTIQETQEKESKKEQDKRKPVAIHNVQQRCEHCNKFVSVSSIDDHVASHEKERETFTFKTSSNQSAASSHSYKTVVGIEPHRQSEYETGAHSNNDEQRMRDNENERRTTQSGDQFLTSPDAQEDVGAINSGQDISEDIPQNVAQYEQRQTQDDARKSRFRLLWKEHYKRMLEANEDGKEELYKKFLNVYASLGNRGVLCQRRLNFASVNKRRQRLVNDDSMVTMETHTTCQSGINVTRRRITYLKTIKYQTSEYVVGTD